jgi:hypothetical protein
MNYTAQQKGYKVETYNYGNDFQFLSREEKRGLLKNAKKLLRLQRENDVVGDRNPSIQRKVNS